MRPPCPDFTDPILGRPSLETDLGLHSSFLEHSWVLYPRRGGNAPQSSRIHTMRSSRGPAARPWLQKRGLAGQAGGERDASCRVDGSPFSAHRPLAWLLLCVPLGRWRVSSTVKGTTGEACSDYVLDSSREDTTGGWVVPHFMSVQKKFQMVGLTCPENESSCLFSCTLLVRLYCVQHQQSTTSESVGAGIHR